jgi:C4-dicarboxylate-specific signal transduction histidine kinase
VQLIFDTIVNSAICLCRADVGSLRLCEEEGFRLVALKGHPSSQFERWVQPVQSAASCGAYAQLVARRSAVHIPDLTADETFRGSAPHIFEAYKLQGTRTYLLVPMLKEEEIIGSIVVGRVRVQPFTDKQIELITDIAAQATLALGITCRERQYREVQHELLCHANRVAVIGQLTASIAHELKQPLCAVAVNGDSALRWLAMQPPDLGEVKLSLERVIKSAHRGRDIIAGLMDLTRKQPLRKEPVDINEAIQEVTVLTHGEALKHGVSLRAQLAPQLAHIEGDRIQIQQVVLNLTINAIQAMSAADGRPRELLISTEGIAGEGVRVGVRDSGPGLSPEILPRLFDPFYTTKATGVGLGLAICRSIIDADGCGRLRASQGGLSSSLRFLPVRAQSRDQAMSAIGPSRDLACALQSGSFQTDIKRQAGPAGSVANDPPAEVKPLILPCRTTPLVQSKIW